jgi:hypothetical protein
MKRHWLLALAALAILPRLGQAQDNGWGPRLRITPFVGVSPGIDQKGTAAIFENGTTSFHPYTLNMGSALPVGLNVEYRFWQRFGVIAGGLWASRGNGRLDDFEDEVSTTTTGNNTFMAKLGPALHLRESNPDMQLKRLNATVYVAGAFMHDNAKDNIALPANANGSMNMWGLNLGADAELPLANTRFAFQLGFEDFMYFWDEDNYAERLQPYFSSTADAFAIDVDKTHMFIARVGLSFRFK